MKKIRLEDIAKRLNLTKVSVSKALRDHTDISAETRKRVKEVAEEMGYRPNQIARSLTSAKTKTLGVVIPKIAHNFFAFVVEGIQKQAASAGYEIVLMVTDELEDLESRHIETLVSMQVEGLLVSVSMNTRNTEIFSWIRELQVPLVFFDRHIDGLGFNSIVIDDVGAARDAVSRLLKLHGSSIAHLAGYDHVGIARNRRQGYEQALTQHGLKVDPNCIVEGGLGEEDGYNGFKQLMKRGVRPDSLFAVTFPVALGAYLAMHEIDSTLPDKISVLAFGESGYRGTVRYPHYYVDQLGIKMGKRAAELLLDEIEGRIQPGGSVEFIETRFVETAKVNFRQITA